MRGSGGCPAETLSALVDGELDHAARERAQAHLAHCSGCRGEVEQLRRTKAVLGAAPAAQPRPELVDRLLHLAVPGVEPHAQPGARSRGRDPVRPGPASRRPAARLSERSGGSVRPAAAGRRSRRRAAAGGLILAGLGAAFVLGGGQRPVPPTTRVDPATAAFVSDYYSTTSEVPLTDSVTSTSLVVVPARHR